MKTALAWIVGIVVAAVIVNGLTLVASALGIPTWIDFGETVFFRVGSGPFSYDDEADGAFTAYGLAMMIAAVILGVRAGMAVRAGRLDGGLSIKQEIGCRAWLYGLAVYGAIGAALWLGFGDTAQGGGIIRALEFGAAVATFWFFKRWRDRQLSAL